MVQGLSNTISEKRCNQVLYCLRKNAKALKTFSTTCNTLLDVRAVLHSFQNDHIIDSRFTKIEDTCTNGLSFTMYNRDPCQVLMEQLATTMSEDVVTEHWEAIRISHPLNAEIETATCKAMEVEAKLSLLEHVSWKDDWSVPIRSAVDCIQLDSNKSQTLLSTGSLALYPLRDTVLNFLEGVRRGYIVNGSTLLAYFILKRITVRIRRIRKKMGPLAIEQRLRLFQLSKSVFRWHWLSLHGLHLLV